MAKSPRPGHPHPSGLLQIEELEPRVLFSADGLDPLADANVPYAAAQVQVVQTTPTAASGAARHTQQSATREIAFVDTGVENYQALVAEIQNQSDGTRDIEVVLLDTRRDGVSQIDAALSNRDHIDALHVISHGSRGVLQLGDTTLDVQTLLTRAGSIQRWGDALSEQADILLYGCDVAGSQVGRSLIDALSRLTGADVAASADLTGGAAQGGDWELEIQTGLIESRMTLSAQASFSGVLDITTGLVGQWTYDTNANDASGNLYHGTLTNGPTINSGTKVVGAGSVSLDGSDDYVDLSSHVTNFQGLTQGTIAAWVRPTTTNYGVIFETSDSSDTDSRVALINEFGDFRWYIYEGSTVLVEGTATGSTLPANTWTHVAVTVDATNGNQLYVNGAQVTPTYSTGSSSTNHFFDDVTQLDFMAWGVDKYNTSTFGGPFAGLIDEGRVYNRALSSTDIAELYAYNGNTAPSLSGLISDSLAYSEGDGAVVIEQGGDATVTDSDSADFNTGTLSVSFTAGSDGTEDVLSIRNQGTGAGQIGVSGSNVTYAGTTIGTFAGGGSGSSLVVTFNASSSVAAAQALIRNITFQDTDTSAPTTGARTVRFVLTDGDGGTSPNYDATVTVSAVNDRPVLDNSGTMTLTTITEDDIGNSGQTVASIIASAGGDRITDPDSGAQEGIAIVSLNSGSGTWQYNIGAGWVNAGAVSRTAALLLRDSDSLRFVPDGEGADTASLTFNGWDRSVGTAGSKVTVGTTADVLDQFSSTSYSNNHGSQNWSAAWTESDSGGNGPSAGNVQISSNTLRFDADTNGDKISRQVDLTNTANATLSFSYTNDFGGADRVAVRISNDGGSNYTTLPDGLFSGLLRTGSGTASFDISSYASATTLVEFIVTGVGAGNRFYVDNVRIEYGVVSASEAFSTASETATLTVSASNDTPTDLSLSASTVAENAPVGTSIGTVSATDPDSGDSATFSLTDSAGGRFAIHSGTGLITVANGALLNYESATSHAVTVRVTDSGGLTYDESFTISLTNVNEQPNFTNLNGTPAHTEGGSAVVLDGNAQISDAELSAADNFSGAVLTLTRNAGTSSADVFSATGTLSLSFGNAVVGGTTIGTFTHNGGTLAITFNGNATSALVNSTLQQIAYSNSSEAPPATVQIDWTFDDGNSGAQGSGGALQATGSTTVSITAVNDEQMLATNAGMTVSEGSTGTTIGNTMLATTDVDNTAAQLVYTVTAVPANGTLRLSGAAIGTNGTFTQDDLDNNRVTYDHNGAETTADSFAFSVDDGAGTASTDTFNITVTAVNDNAPVITSDLGASSASITVNENTTAVTTVTATDADLPANTLTYAISGTDAALFSINASSGVLTFIGAPDYETALDSGGNNVYDLVVEVSDGLNTDTQTLAVTVADVSSALVVTTAADNNDAAIVAGNAAHTAEWLYVNSGGAISLREAIIAANNQAGLNTITFSIAGVGVQTIGVGGTALGALPAITDAVLIEGYSQTGASVNTAAAGSNAVLLIELEGSSAGGTADGLHLAAGSSGSTIRGLVIHGFADDGIVIDSDSNTLSGNFIGTNSSGSGAIGVGDDGIDINVGADNNAIGGTTLAARNVISGNSDKGMVVGGTGSLVRNNLIGLGADGATDLGNADSGIVITADGNTIGGDSAYGNVISGNANFGIGILGGSTNIVAGNLIGLDATGSLDRGNDSDGVSVRFGSNNNLIGGTTAGARNVISGNLRGVLIIDGVTGNTVAGNYIGTDVTGEIDRGNDMDGVSINGSNANTVGGASSAARNVISGNDYGIVLTNGATGNTIQSNYLGTDDDGVQDLGNNHSGIYIDGGASNVIGGAGAGNVVSGNDGYGMYVANSSANLFRGNYIGVDNTGGVALGNTFNGIYMGGGTANLIGGSVAGQGNIIGGNGDIGVRFEGGSAHVVQGNSIGVGADGSSAVGNLVGVSARFGATDLLIGGTTTTQANVIANNGHGVVVEDATTARIAILGNGISDSTQLGINLVSAGDPGSGVTANDIDLVAPIAHDTDTGPNGLQNFPVLVTASLSGADLSLTGTLQTEASKTYRIEFFLNAAGSEDGSGYGEGAIYLGSANVNTDANGEAAISVTFNGTSALTGDFIVATATEDLGGGNFGGTSEFALNVAATSTNNAPVNTVPGAQTANEDTALAISGISVNDVDGNLATVQLNVTNGVLSVTLSGAASISAGGNGSASLTLSGTQTDINATLASLTYQGTHDFNGADTLTVLSTDAATASASVTVAITVTPVNDNAPVFTSGATPSLAENGSAVLALGATDADLPAAPLSYTIVGGVDAGLFTLNAVTGALSFNAAPDFEAAADVGGNNVYNLTVQVSDGLNTTTQGLSITITDANESPAVDINALTLTQGSTVILAGANLSATDPESAPGALAFTVSGVGAGQFEMVATPGVAITTFTQAQVTSALVQFIHDGSATAPTWQVVVSDGVLTSAASTAIVSFTPASTGGGEPPIVLPPPDADSGGGGDPVTGPGSGGDTGGGSTPDPTSGSDSTADSAAEGGSLASALLAFLPPQVFSAVPTDATVLGSPARTLFEMREASALARTLMARIEAAVRPTEDAGSFQDLGWNAWRSGNTNVAVSLASGTYEEMGLGELPAKQQADDTRLGAVLSPSLWGGLIAGFGTAWWAGRAGVLLASAALSTPAWARLDPLPIASPKYDSEDNDQDPPEAEGVISARD